MLVKSYFQLSICLTKAHTQKKCCLSAFEISKQLQKYFKHLSDSALSYFSKPSSCVFVPSKNCRADSNSSLFLQYQGFSYKIALLTQQFVFHHSGELSLRSIPWVHIHSKRRVVNGQTESVEELFVFHDGISEYLQETGTVQLN